MKNTIQYILVIVLVGVIGFALFQNYEYSNYRDESFNKIDSLTLKNTFLVHSIQNLEIVSERLQNAIKTKDSLYNVKKKQDSTIMVKKYNQLKKELLDKEPDERVDYFLDKTSDSLVYISSIELSFLIPLKNIDSANMIILERDRLDNEISLLLSNEEYLNKKINDLGFVIVNKDAIINKLEEMRSNNKTMIDKKNIRLLEQSGIIRGKETKIKYLCGLAALLAIIAIIK